MATAKPQNLPKILRIGVIQGGKIIEERLVKKRDTVTIGQGPKNSIVIPVSNLPATFPVFEMKGNAYQLRFTEKMDGKLSVGENQLDFASLKTQGLAKKDKDAFAVPLTELSKGKIALGEVTLLFQFVVPPPEPPKAVLPDIAKGNPWQTMDKLFFGIMATVMVVNFGGLKGISMLPHPKEDELTLEELPDRFVKMIIPDKPKEEPKKKETASEGDKPKEDKPKEKAKAATEDKPVTAEAAAAAAAARKAAVTEGVKKTGLLKLLGSVGGDGTGALEDVLGGGSAATDISSALAGAGGVGVASGDALAEAGERKGSGAGTTAGIGDLATAGGAGKGAALAEKAVAAVTGRVIDQGPEVESSSCDRNAIAKYVKGRIRAITGCYEKELKRNTGLKGKIVVRFTITETGRVKDVEIDENTLGNDQVVNCIKATIRSWVFPIKDNECPVAYPFVFSPAG